MDESQELDLGKFKSELEALSFTNLTRVLETVLDIDDKFQIYKSSRLEIRFALQGQRPPLSPAETHEAEQARKDSLHFLKSKGIVQTFDFKNPGAYIGSIAVTISAPRLVRSKPLIVEQYKRRAAPDEPKTPAADNHHPVTQNPHAIYEVKFTAAREILINGFLLTRLDFDSENDNVFKYLYEHPNQTISAAELEKQLGGTPLRKSLHKIVENLGFVREIKRVFFDISKDSIRFRNPITDKELEALGITRLRFPRR